MRIEVVDPRDEADFGRWFAVLDAVDQDTRPGEAGWAAQDQRAMAVAGYDPATAVSELITLLIAFDESAAEGETAVGIGKLVLTIRDNTDRCRALALVHPDHRRRGVGTALLEDLLSRARAAGRTVASGEVDEPEHLAGRSPARAFLERHGFALALTDVRRDLALPPDPERLATAAATAASYAGGIEVRTYRDRCPDDLLEARAALGRAMSVMFPAGDLVLEEEAWDADRIRATEQLFATQGRHYTGAIALDGGEAVAFTEMGINASEPSRAYQWDTLVLPSHRGRRLGTVVKLAALRAFVADWPQARLMTTWNAEGNAPMVAVNDALGFRPNGTLTTWQRDL